MNDNYKVYCLDCMAEYKSTSRTVCPNCGQKDVADMTDCPIIELPVKPLIVEVA